jgi:hypothetical protein
MKTYERADLALVAVLSGLIGLCLGIVVGMCTEDASLKTQAIRVGAAHYNPTNAVFTWGSFTNSAK